MAPILAVASVVSAAAAVIKGAVWLADQISGDDKVARVADKGAPKSGDTAAEGSFQAALSAQMTGHEMPSGPMGAPVRGSSGAPASTDATVATLRLSEDDVRARVQAGMTAYGRIGDRRDAEPTGVSADRSAERAG